LNDEIQKNKTSTKDPWKKLETKRIMTKLKKKKIYDKLELNDKIENK
jgi:hypothetical protein